MARKYFFVLLIQCLKELCTCEVNVVNDSVKDTIVQIYLEDVAQLHRTKEFTHPWESQGGLFNVFPKIMIDLDDTVEIDESEKTIFLYAALNNQFRVMKGLEPTEIWISSAMLSPRNTTAFSADDLVLLAQRPNNIFPGTISGFVLYAGFRLDESNSLDVLGKEAKRIYPLLSRNNLTIWIIMTIGYKCDKKYSFTFPLVKFSFHTFEKTYCTKCPTKPYEGRTKNVNLDDCFNMREAFSPIDSPKLIVHLGGAMFFDSGRRTGQVFTKYYGNISHFKDQTHMLMTKCEVLCMPSILPFFSSHDSTNTVFNSETLIDRNFLSFSLFIEKLPKNASVLLQTLLQTVSRITITNFYNLTSESATQINSTLREIINIKEQTDNSLDCFQTDSRNSVHIEVSILLAHYQYGNQIEFLEVLDEVFNNSVVINKSTKTISAVVITQFNLNWTDILNHLAILERRNPDQSIYGPKFGIVTHVNVCNPYFVSTIVKQIQNSGISMQIWLENYVSPYNNGRHHSGSNLPVSNFNNVLDSLQQCKKVFEKEDLKSENKIFYYSTIIACKIVRDGATKTGEAEYGAIIDKISDLIVSSGTFVTISTAFEYLELPNTTEIFQVQPNASSSQTCSVPHHYALPDCLKKDICGFWQVHINNNSVGNYTIKDKKTVAREKQNKQPTGTTSHQVQNLASINSTELARTFISSSTRHYDIGTTLSPSSTTETSQTYLVFLLFPIIIVVVIVAIVIIYALRYRQNGILPAVELREFYNERSSITSVTGTELACSLKYDKTRYEISRTCFEFDTSECLGFGEFGVVYPGKLIDENITVAVKTLKKRSKVMDQSSIPSLRGLLSEIKILSFLGEHEHIIKLYGANTEQLRTGNVMVILEMCSFGSLASYLRNLQTNEEHDSVNSTSICSHNTQFEKFKGDLYRWSNEIAAGMEFVASKRLVHADLATRNILLDMNKTAKIADFGLSRRLYDYTHYVKTTDEPLPWRWMAPEALKRMEFCEKTYVWAFGVTLWEIYMLADTPYPGLSWDVNFPNMLEDGLKLGMPKYDDRGVYSVMVQCWKINPDSRPTFSEIREKLTNITISRNSDGYVTA